MVGVKLACFLAFLAVVHDEILLASGYRLRNEGGGGFSDIQTNNRPIIGILTQDADFGPEMAISEEIGVFRPSEEDKEATEYIPASYVKFVEASGARVIAVRYKQSKETLQEIFRKLNGMLLPGGGMSLEPDTKYYKAGEALWEFIENEQPDYPLFGTCLGFEFISSLAAGSHNILVDSGKFNASNSTLNLKLSKEAFSSQLFKYVVESPKVLDAVVNHNISYNEHSSGITPSAFKRYSHLNKNFDILATSIDNSGKTFVAAFESKASSKFDNIFAVQFHPEKNVFEWFSKGNFPHSLEAIQLAQFVGNVFIESARNNFNSFEVDPIQEMQFLIQNHKKTFNGNKYFEEVYVFYEDEPQLGLDIEAEKDTMWEPESWSEVVFT